jgi:HD-GYP domain-containing protein (c-di-GMP phosphodiesterase class II)
MTDQNIGNKENTDNSQNDNQATVKTFTQDEVNAILAKTKSQLEKKYSSKYEELGDPDTLRQIVSEHQKIQQEQQLKRGEFDRVIQELAAKKDAEIQKRDRVIESFKVETPIVDAAARYRAVNPEQVKALIRNQVRLSPEGEVEVLDEKGSVRYDDSGKPVSVDSFVQSWLQSNPHFVSAAPATTNTRSNVTGNTAKKVDMKNLDMKNPEHRKIYADYRKTAGLA